MILRTGTKPEAFIREACLIMNLRLCLLRKIQLTVYRSLFAHEKSDSVQKVTFTDFFLFNFLLYPLKRLE